MVEFFKDIFYINRSISGCVFVIWCIVLILMVPLSIAAIMINNPYYLVIPILNIICLVYICIRRTYTMYLNIFLKKGKK